MDTSDETTDLSFSKKDQNTSNGNKFINNDLTDSSSDEEETSDVVCSHNTNDSLTSNHWQEGVKCPHCSYIGHSSIRLEQHLAKIHEEETTYKCKTCDFTCKWNREYYQHIKSHYRGPPYKCNDCDYTCDRIQFMLSHERRHSNEMPYQCRQCPFQSRTKGNLIIHTRTHTGEKPYKCDFCGRTFAIKNTLEQHLATHSNERPYSCESCNFSAKYKSHLLSHKRIHTGNVYRCSFSGCLYITPRKSQLQVHMKNHCSQRDHICPTCGRGFVEKSHLIRHERIHLDEKPFKCETCNYASTRRDKLKEHIFKHHHSDGLNKEISMIKSGNPSSNDGHSSLTLHDVIESQHIVSSPSRMQ